MAEKPTDAESEKRVGRLEKAQPGQDLERLLNATQRLTRAGGWEWDVASRSMIWTEETYRIHGFEPGELMPGCPEHIAKSLACYSPEDRTVVQAAFQRCAERGEPYDLEFPFTSAKGRRIWIRTTAEAVMVQGRVAKVVGNIMDITERKLAEKELRWNARRNELLSDTAARLLQGGDLQRLVEDLCLRVMEFLDCDAFFNFLADPQAGRLRLNAYAGIPEDAARRIQWIDYGVAVCGRVARDGKPMVCQDILDSDDLGTELVKSWGIQAYGCHPLMIQGRLIGTLSFGTRARARFSPEEVKVMAAVTNLVAVAMIRIETEQALRESEEKFRLTFNSSPDAVNLNRLEDGLYVDINQGFTDLTGFTRQDVIGKTSLDIRVWHDADDRKKLIRALEEKGCCDNLEARFRRKDGSLTTALMSARIISLKDVPHIISITRDISERKQAEEQVRRLEKAESLGRMAGAIAHHFNNQLSVVTGNLELALDGLPGDAGPRGFLIEAMDAARRSAKISGLMLTYLGQSTGRQEPLDLSALCRKNLPLLQDALPKGILLETDLMDPGPVVRASAGHMFQILTHLIQNAGEAIGDRNGKVALSTGTIRASDIPTSHRVPADWQPSADVVACLEVTDSGSGITKADIDRLFDPFFTTKFTGRGLGLPVVLGIVRAWKGAISIESRRSRGSSFCVYLPLAADDVSPRSENAHGALSSDEAGTVLLVEAQSPERKMVATMLQRLGFSVLAASSGTDALNLFRLHRHAIRCVITDPTMPGMDGWKTLAALRKIQPNLPAILAGGYDEIPSMGREDSVQPDVFLHKPYSKAELKAALGRAMGDPAPKAR